MSEDQVTQPVVDETPAQAQPGATVQDARPEDDLDKLLSEFSAADEARSKPVTPEPDVKADDLNALAAEAKTVLTTLNERQFRTDMDATIKAVRGELAADVFDDDVVEAWIETQAKRDKRLPTAWAGRHQNPKGFQKVVDGLSREFAKRYGKLPDKAATDDREAVAAAVRGASNKAPESKAPDLASMSDAEFREHTRKSYGFTPSL